MAKKFRISRKVGKFTLDRRILASLITLSLALAGWQFLSENPQHNPWAPLDLRDPVGWATQSKLSALRSDPAPCRAVLSRSNVTFSALQPIGEGTCARPDRTVLTGIAFTPQQPAMTCPVAAGLSLWIERSVNPAAKEIIGQEIRSIIHMGTYSCRRMYNDADAPWSEHATGNAIDIAGFILADGSRVSILDHWEGGGDKALFLRRIRDEACPIFGTVLSPEYNAAHRDHFHFDQAGRAWETCR